MRKFILAALAIALTASPALACYDNLSCIQERNERALYDMERQQQQQLQQQELLRQQENMLRQLQIEQQKAYQQPADWLRR